MTYGILGWGACGKTTLQKVNVVQKAIIRIMLRKPRRYPSDDLFLEAQLLDLRQLYCLKAIFHIKNTTIIPENSERTGRYKENFKVQKRLTSFGQRHYSFLAPRMANIMSKHMLGISRKQQKYRLKLWLINLGRRETENTFMTILK